MADDADNEGIWGGWLRGPQGQWASDAREYLLADLSSPPLRIRVRKQVPRTLEVIVTGPGEESRVFRERIPALQRDPRGMLALHVTVTWQLPHVKLYLHGKLTTAGPASAPY
jgi:hypothetical protein